MRLKLSRQNASSYFIVATWGGPPGPRPTPTSACSSRVMAEPDQRFRRGRGRPPHCGLRGLYGGLLTQESCGMPL
jgi:hypothetical protein